MRNFLTRFGLDIAPYYWFKEEKNNGEPPKIKEGLENYTIALIPPSEVSVMDGVMGLSTSFLIKNMERGQVCIGLRVADRIATLLFIDPNDFTFKHRNFHIEDGSGYLLNLYTFEDYRGNNLAAYLRYNCYDVLKHLNITTIYSITSYFNRSSIRVNEKINAKKLKLYLHIGLFKKWHWNFLLKDYER
ncbi:hypothetical protein [Pareuzebyella sediminis]|uniref:hypothetical protein n=1 Tax=Pareuzebyella sediminis TaxID=2607998 RepID=UPI0011EC45A6|nr:hypothetical protein [Pareuzebyella sediminis]